MLKNNVIGARVIALPRNVIGFVDEATGAFIMADSTDPVARKARIMAEVDEKIAAAREPDHSMTDEYLASRFGHRAATDRRELVQSRGDRRRVPGRSSWKAQRPDQVRRVPTL
ncbi:MAG: hypothetical protein WCJ29_04210 [bacterium]